MSGICTLSSYVRKKESYVKLTAWTFNFAEYKEWYGNLENDYDLPEGFVALTSSQFRCSERWNLF